MFRPLELSLVTTNLADFLKGILMKQLNERPSGSANSSFSKTVFLPNPIPKKSPKGAGFQRSETGTSLYYCSPVVQAHFLFYRNTIPRQCKIAIRIGGFVSWLVNS